MKEPLNHLNSSLIHLRWSEGHVRAASVRRFHQAVIEIATGIRSLDALSGNPTVDALDGNMLVFWDHRRWDLRAKTLVPGLLVWC